MGWLLMEVSCWCTVLIEGELKSGGLLVIGAEGLVIHVEQKVSSNIRMCCDV